LAKKAIEFPLKQLAGVVLTFIGFCFCLYFFVLLNNRLSVYDFQHPIYGWTEILEAVPYGGVAMLFGLGFILVGIILGISGNIVIKRKENSK
jgi:hypothetical protein